MKILTEEKNSRMLPHRLLTGAALLGALSFSFLPPVFAERVSAIEKEAVLRLESGGRVFLAGLDLPEESIPLLSILLSGKDVEISGDQKNTAPEAGLPAPSYLYVKTSEIELPFANAVPATEKKVMINELLVAIGAARVKTELEFDHKQDFILLEEKARVAGQGLWSYAEPAPSPPVSGTT